MAILVPENDIQQVKDFIESHHFMRALKMINTLQCKYPSSALVLALKALLYERTGRSETIDICSDAKKNFFTDTSVLPDVLGTLQIVFQRLGEHHLATQYYEYACENVPNSLALMTGLFYCYVRGLSFIDQLKISLKMYKFDRQLGSRFLFWSVLSIQTQVLYRLLTEHVNLCKREEPETLLACISVTRQQTKNDLAHEILSKLGLTLLVAEVGGRRLKGVRLLAHVCDYTAAAEVLSQKMESCLDDWDCVVNNLCQLLGNDGELCAEIVKSQIAVSQSSECELQAGSRIPVILRKADLRHLVMGRRCVDGINFELENAVHEYFGRLGSTTEVSFQVLPMVDELRLIKNLRQNKVSWGPALQEAFNGLHTIGRTRGKIDPALKTVYHGTSIALKTNKYIILAADGKLTSKTSYNALKLKADKVKDFGDMCVALSGNWINSAKMVSTLSTCMRFLKDENKSRPTISKFAKFTSRKLYSRMRDTGIIFAGFDQLKDGEPAVPCISYAWGHQNFDVEKSFYCHGTGYNYANTVLSKEKVRSNMELDDAIALVEKALVYASRHDGCTGGWASILVIEYGEYGSTINRMPREDICSTLWYRHRSWLECMEA